MRILLLLVMLLSGISTSIYSQDFFINDDFRDALVADGVDTNSDGLISKLEAHSITTIDVENEKLTDLAGIDEFKKLKVLKCSYNYLSSLDLTGNTLLEEVQCFQNRLTSINVSANNKIEGIYCFENNLSSIDVSSNPNLKNFQCYKNELSSLDLSSNTELTRLDCSWNNISELDVSTNTKLNYLACGENLFDYLDLSYNTELTELYCGRTNLTTLDLTKCRKLSSLDASGIDHLKSICVWNLSEAESNLSFYKDSWVDYVTDCALNFKGNNFKNELKNQNFDKNSDGYITLTEVENVKTLNVDGDPFGKTSANKLDNINGIDGFVNLEVLSMSFNQVKEMDISRNTKLKSLSCKNNGMISLDISYNTNLTSLNCKGNNIDKIYVWDIAYAEGNSGFRKDASSTWAIHEVLSFDNTDLFNVKIYPIPLNNYLIVESDVDADLVMFNLLGVEVINNIKIKKGYNRINLDLKPDVYLMILQGEKSRIVRRVLIE